ncbi:MAG: hypothetical protein PHQ12_13605 [Chthoniobacteraceae bacterium]|nr:hypothetical protein [Chthoniobacteraceae bacterium]
MKKLWSPLSTNPVLTAQIDDAAERGDAYSDPSFYERDISLLAENHDPFAENESLHEAQMWSNYSTPTSKDEREALDQEPLLDRTLSFVDDAADTDYILALSTKGPHAMDRHLEDGMYGDSSRNSRRRPKGAPMKDSKKRRAVAALALIRKHNPAAFMAIVQKARSRKNRRRTSTTGHGLPTEIMGSGLPTEILGADYGSRSNIGAPLTRAALAKMTPQQRIAAIAARRKEILAQRATKKPFAKPSSTPASNPAQAAQIAKQQATLRANKIQMAKANAQLAARRKAEQDRKKRAAQLSAAQAKREAARKRKAAQVARALAHAKRRLARKAAAPGAPTASPLTVNPATSPGQAPSVNVAPQGGAPMPVMIQPAPSLPAPQHNPTYSEATSAQSDPATAQQYAAHIPGADNEYAAAPEEYPTAEEETAPGDAMEAPEATLTDDEAQTAEAEAEVDDANADASEAEAEATEAESSDEEVAPDDMAGDFVGCLPANKTKVLRVAGERSPRGAKVRAGMNTYRKVMAGDPVAKQAVVSMAKKAENGDMQAKRDLMAVKVGKVAQNQFSGAKRAWANIKRAAARKSGVDFISMLKTSSMKARDRYDNSLKLQRRAAAGDAKAVEFIHTVNKAAQAGDQAAIRAQKNLALAALVIAHTQTPAQKAQFDADWRLVKASRSRLGGGDARRQIATVFAAGKSGDKSSQHRMEHIRLAGLVLDMISGRDWKVTPKAITEAGGKLPAVPATVQAAAATIAAAVSGHGKAKRKLRHTARAAMKGNMTAIAMMGDVALVGAMLKAKKGLPPDRKLSEAHKIVTQAGNGNAEAKRTIMRAAEAAKKGDPNAVASMVALTAAQKAQKAGGLPVNVAPQAPKGRLASLFSGYRAGVASRSR